MGVHELIKRTSVANVVSGCILIIACVYCYMQGDISTLKELALIAAGYLFGSTVPRWGGNEGSK